MNSRYSTAGSAHQRDVRTQLFGPNPGAAGRTPPARMSSPYEARPTASAKHNEAFLLSLESQNNDEMDLMSHKVAALKNLGVRMGSEINKSMKLNDEITNNFERGTVTLKNTFNRMVVMSQRAGISWRMWLLFFTFFFAACFYVWLV